MRFPAHAAVCAGWLKYPRNPLAQCWPSGYNVHSCSGLPRQRKTPTTQPWKNASGTRQTNSGPGRCPGEAVSDEDFKEQLETMNEELESLNAAARDLEVTIAQNVAEILES